MNTIYSTKEDKELSKLLWENTFKDSQFFIDFYFNFLHRDENLLIYKENKNYLASLYENPYQLKLNSFMNTARYLVAVAVLPEYRGTGIMRKLLEYSLRSSFKRGETSIFLSPIDPAIYRRFGFDYTFNLEEYSFSIEELKTFRKKDNFLRITENNILENIANLKKVYDGAMKSFDNYLERKEEYFIRYLKELESEDGLLYLVVRENEPVGYISLFFQDEFINVRELFFKDKTSLASIFFLLYSHCNYYQKIKITTFENSNFNHYLPNQKKVTKINYPFLMSRILNAEKALKHYLKSKSFPEDLSFSLEISDPIIEENNAIFLIEGTNLKKCSFTSDMKMEISVFSQLIFGYFSLEELIQLEKVEILNYDRMRALFEFFSKSKNYIHEYV